MEGSQHQGAGEGQAKWNQSPLVCHGHSRPIVGLHFRYDGTERDYATVL